MATEAAKKLFAGANNAKVFEKGIHFDGEGRYRLKVLKTIHKNSEQGKGPMFIAEFEVLESNNPAHPVGSQRVWIQKLQNTMVAFGALKVFVYACSGLDMQRDKDTIAKEVDPQMEDLLADGVEKNVFANSEIYLQTIPTTTKENKPFTRHNFKSVT